MVVLDVFAEDQVQSILHFARRAPGVNLDPEVRAGSAGIDSFANFPEFKFCFRLGSICGELGDVTGFVNSAAHAIGPRFF
jgi:hypothetical protein